MVIKSKIILILCFLESLLYSQVNISLDRECTKKNSAIFAQALIDCVGEEKVIELLDNSIKIVTFWEIDSLGRIIRFNKLITEKEISECFIDNLEIYFKKNDVRLFICYEKLPDYCDSSAYKIITRDLIDRNEKTFLINVSFPGELLNLYNEQKEKANKEDISLTKYEYLNEQINKLLTR
jgi:hypothetical protein